MPIEAEHPKRYIVMHENKVQSRYIYSERTKRRDYICNTLKQITSGYCTLGKWFCFRGTPMPCRVLYLIDFRTGIGTHFLILYYCQRRLSTIAKIPTHGSLFSTCILFPSRGIATAHNITMGTYSYLNYINAFHFFSK